MHPPEYQRPNPRLTAKDGHVQKGKGGHKTKLTAEQKAAGMTPNSGKLKKDGSPVPGQDAAHDATRASERAKVVKPDEPPIVV